MKYSIMSLMFVKLLNLGTFKFFVIYLMCDVDFIYRHSFW